MKGYSFQELVLLAQSKVSKSGDEMSGPLEVRDAAGRVVRLVSNSDGGHVQGGNVLGSNTQVLNFSGYLGAELDRLDIKIKGQNTVRVNGKAVFNEGYAPSTTQVGLQKILQRSGGTPRYIRLAKLGPTDSDIGFILSGLGDFGHPARQQWTVNAGTRINHQYPVMVQALRDFPDFYGQPPKLFYRVSGKGEGNFVEIWYKTPAYSADTTMTLLNATSGFMTVDGYTETEPADLVGVIVGQTYSSIHKPTPLDIGAYPKTGGTIDGAATITGTLIVQSGIETTGYVYAGIQGDRPALGLGGNKDGGYAEIAPRPGVSGSFLWAKALRFYASDNTWRVGTDRIYHEGYETTPGKIGAVSKTGDLMSGRLRFTGNSSGATAEAQIEHLGSDATQAVYTRNMREHISSSWIWEKVYNGSIYYSTGTTGQGQAKVRLAVGGTGEIYLGNADKRVYHEGYETTPAKIGAYSKTEADDKYFLKSGGVISGQATFDAGTSFRAASYWMPNDAANRPNEGLGISWNQSGYAEIVKRHANAWQWDTGLRAYGGDDWRVGTKRIYHEGYETTPAKIGAYTKAESDNRFFLSSLVNTEQSQRWTEIIGRVPRVNSGGGIELGNSLDLRRATSDVDYAFRIGVDANTRFVLTGPDASTYMYVDGDRAWFKTGVNVQGGLAVSQGITSDNGYLQLKNGGVQALEFHKPGTAASMLYQTDNGAMILATSNGAGGATAGRWTSHANGNFQTHGAILSDGAIYEGNQRVFSPGNRQGVLTLQAPGQEVSVLNVTRGLGLYLFMVKIRNVWVSLVCTENQLFTYGAYVLNMGGEHADQERGGFLTATVVNANVMQVRINNQLQAIGAVYAM